MVFCGAPSMLNELTTGSGAIASAAFRSSVVAAGSSIARVHNDAPPKRYFATKAIRSA